jgi:serine/threonine protein kinase
LNNKDDSWLNEIDILKQVEHKNILRMLAISVDVQKQNGLFCCEYMQTDLETVYKNNQIKSIKTIVGLARQISLAMVYLNKKYIIHRDIRCKNVFTNEHFFVKLANFGLSKNLDSNGEYKIKSDIQESIIEIFLLHIKVRQI